MMPMEIAEIIEKIAELPKGALLREALVTPKSSKQRFDEAFYIKLGPLPAFGDGK